VCRRARSYDAQDQQHSQGPVQAPLLAMLLLLLLLLLLVIQVNLSLFK
jgi:hypothetical protein